jgi:hypothetical protein
MDINPRFMILEAQPERYIRRLSSAVLALIRLAEGIAAGYLAYMGGRFVIENFGEWFNGVDASLNAFLHSMIPPEILDLAEQEGGFSLQTYAATGSVASFLASGIILCVLVLLGCTVVEGLVMPFLFITLKGSGLLAGARKGLFLASRVLVMFLVCFVLLQLISYYRRGVLPNLLAGKIPWPAIVAASSIPIMAVRSRLHKCVVTVFRAVDFELRLKFKETHVADIRLSRYLLLFGVLFLAAAGLSWWKMGPMSIPCWVTAAETLKYAMAAISWGNFKQRHM